MRAGSQGRRGQGAPGRAPEVIGRILLGHAAGVAAESVKVLAPPCPPTERAGAG